MGQCLERNDGFATDMGAVTGFNDVALTIARLDHDRTLVWNAVKALQ